MLHVTFVLRLCFAPSLNLTETCFSRVDILVQDPGVTVVPLLKTHAMISIPKLGWNPKAPLEDMVLRQN